MTNPAPVVAEPSAIALAAQLRFAADHLEHIGTDVLAMLMRSAASEVIADSEQTVHQQRHVLEVVEPALRDVAELRTQHDELSSRCVALRESSTRYADLAVRRDDHARMLAHTLRDALVVMEANDGMRFEPRPEVEALLREYSPAAGRAAEPDEDAAEQ